MCRDKKTRPVTENDQKVRQPLKAVSSKIDVALVALQQLSSVEQVRKDELMMWNSEGNLTASECADLAALVEEHEQMLMANLRGCIVRRNPCSLRASM